MSDSGGDDEQKAMELLGLPAKFFNSNAEKKRKRGKKQEAPNKKIKNPNYQKGSSEVKEKFYSQRYTLWSRFDDGIKMDDESWYSVTPEWIAKETAEHIVYCLDDPEREPHLVILDCFCGAGGNVVQFALHPRVKKVIAVDIDPAKIELTQNNTKVYECSEDKIELICKDYKEVIEEFKQNSTHVDCIYLSPPWGGPEYLTLKKFRLKDMCPDGEEIVNNVKELSRNIAIFVPRNFDLYECDKISSKIYTKSEFELANETGDYLYYVYEHFAPIKHTPFTKVKAQTVCFNDLSQGYPDE